MSLIHVNRKIFLDLSNDELKKQYVNDCVYSSFPNGDFFDGSEYDYITKGISHIIKSNEDFNNKYGKVQKNGLKQVDETCMIPAFEQPTGSYYSSGSLIIYPFDWSWDDNGDFNYSFVISRVY